MTLVVWSSKKGSIHRHHVVFPFLCRHSFKKPTVKDMVTQDYHKAFATEQGNLKDHKGKPDDDDISVYCGADVDSASRGGSNQGSLLSRLSNKFKPTTPDQLSLLDNNDEADPGDGVKNTRL